LWQQGFVYTRPPFGIAELAFSYCFARFFNPMSCGLTSADLPLIQARISQQIANGLCSQVCFLSVHTILIAVCLHAKRESQFSRWLGNFRHHSGLVSSVLVMHAFLGRLG